MLYWSFTVIVYSSSNISKFGVCINKLFGFQAKSCLRKKKELEKCIEKRAMALDNVLTLLNHIREAESDAKVNQIHYLRKAYFCTLLHFISTFLIYTFIEQVIFIGTCLLYCVNFFTDTWIIQNGIVSIESYF